MGRRHTNLILCFNAQGALWHVGVSSQTAEMNPVRNNLSQQMIALHTDNNFSGYQVANSLRIAHTNTPYQGISGFTYVQA